MSDFYKRKIRTYFRTMDYNKDGFITKEDFELMSERFEDNVDSKMQNTIREKLLKLYNSYEKAAGVDGKITEEQMIEALEKLRHDTEFSNILKEVAEIYFSLLDTDGDGFIQEAEYGTVPNNYSATDYVDLVKTAFESMDTDHDGKLSFEETSAAFYDFMLSEDEAGPGSLFFGPLI